MRVYLSLGMHPTLLTSAMASNLRGPRMDRGLRLLDPASASIVVLNLADWSFAEVPGLTQSIGFVGHPAWSPDGETIAFECEIDPGNRDLCAIRANGTGLVRLTSDLASASLPRFSVDGSKIRFANPDWVVIYADGTGITTATPDDFASPAGTRFVYVVPLVWLRRLQQLL